MSDELSGKAPYGGIYATGAAGWDRNVSAEELARWSARPENSVIWSTREADYRLFMNAVPPLSAAMLAEWFPKPANWWEALKARLGLKWKPKTAPKVIGPKVVIRTPPA